MEQTSNLLRDNKPLNFKLITKEFNKSIHDNVFYINKDYLLLNCNLVKFSKESWKMRPNVFCSDYYEITSISSVILMSNNLKSIFEFLPENLKNHYIIAPKKYAINKVLNCRL